MDFSKKTAKQLKAICKEIGIKGCDKKRKADLIQLLNLRNASVASSEEIDDDSDDESSSISAVIDDEDGDEKKEEVEETDNVLELCKIPDSLDIEQLKESIRIYMDSRANECRLTNRPLIIESWISEVYTARATGGIEIGGGSCGMDVKTGMNEGIDAMCVIMNKTQSNEKSLMQNFSESGKDLDGLFDKKDDTTTTHLFMKGYSKKLLKCKTEKGLNELYILAFISTYTEVFLVCFNINLENIKNVSSGGFVSDKCVNINVNGFINSAYGNVHLYRSKKRMELRLRSAVLKHEHTVKIYSME